MVVALVHSRTLRKQCLPLYPFSGRSKGPLRSSASAWLSCHHPKEFRVFAWDAPEASVIHTSCQLRLSCPEDQYTNGFKSSMPLGDSWEYLCHGGMLICGSCFLPLQNCYSPTLDHMAFHSFFFKFIYLFWERERERETAWVGEEQRERERDRIPSRHRTFSAASDVGLKPMNHDTMTWAELECLTDWATQVPLFIHFCPDVDPQMELTSFL